MKKGEDDEAIDYFNNLVPRMKEEYGDVIQCKQFIQYPGETVWEHLYLVVFTCHI
jgi:hypothetical protein